MMQASNLIELPYLLIELLFRNEFKVLTLDHPLNIILPIILRILNLNVDEPLDALIIVTLLKSQHIDDILHVRAVVRVEGAVYLEDFLALVDPVGQAEDFGGFYAGDVLLIQLDSGLGVVRQFVDVGVLDVQGVLAGGRRGGARRVQQISVSACSIGGIQGCQVAETVGVGSSLRHPGEVHRRLRSQQLHLNGLLDLLSRCLFASNAIVGDRIKFLAQGRLVFVAVFPIKVPGSEAKQCNDDKGDDCEHYDPLGEIEHFSFKCWVMQNIYYKETSLYYNKIPQAFLQKDSVLIFLRQESFRKRFFNFCIQNSNLIK